MAQPERRFKVGGCVASIFVNEIETKEGKVRLKTVNLQRVHKDKHGEWGYTATFRARDIPKAQLVLQKAYEYLVGLEESPPSTGHLEPKSI